MAKRGRKPKFLGVQCPNKRCRKRPPQVVANGRYQTRDGPVRQFLCRACGQGFTERQGTFFYDLRTPHATVLMALKLLVKGMPLRGIAEVLGTKLDTVREWLRRAAEQSARVNDLILRELHVSQVELDALWTFVKKKRLRQRAILWRARSGSGSVWPRSSG